MQSNFFVGLIELQLWSSRVLAIVIVQKHFVDLENVFKCCRRNEKICFTKKKLYCQTGLVSEQLYGLIFTHKPGLIIKTENNSSHVKGSNSFSECN